VKRLVLFAMAAVMLSAGSVYPQNESVIYEREKPYYLWEFMSQIGDSLQAIEDSVTDAIRDAQTARKEYLDSVDKKITFDVSHIDAPKSIDEFTSVYYAPLSNQASTGTCWCFSATSLIESDVHRIHGKELRLSVMFTVYHEYIEKVRAFIRTRGHSPVSQGSESNAIPRMMKMYGAVPLELYTGLPDGDSLHAHSPMKSEINEYLETVKKLNLWNEDYVIDHIKQIMNHHIGTPPESFEWQGKTYTPKSFFADVVQINPDDYIGFMSTLKEPFYKLGYFDAWDNWWYDSTYVNLPLDEWYDIIKQSIKAGYSMTIGGDNSGPGWHHVADLGYVPSFDIPSEFIDQSARELRVANGTTGDDHGMHLVGYLEKPDATWYLFKDSSSGGRRGNVWGYMFVHEDYVRLKMLTFMVHRDAVEDILKKID